MRGLSPPRKRGVFAVCQLDINTPPGYHRAMNQSIKKKVIHRLQIIEGQVRGLRKMVEREAYCIDVINQSLAVKSALSGVEDLMLENHLSSHVVEQIKSGNTTKATREIVNIYKLSKSK